MTEFLEVAGGRIAYDVTGEGPLVVLSHGIDPDFADPRAEGDAIVAAMPSGLGTVAMVNGAGHYPHAQSPDEMAALVIPFLKEHARA